MYTTYVLRAVVLQGFVSIKDCCPLHENLSHHLIKLRISFPHQETLRNESTATLIAHIMKLLHLDRPTATRYLALYQHHTNTYYSKPFSPFDPALTCENATPNRSMVLAYTIPLKNENNLGLTWITRLLTETDVGQ
ncbi:hypothetical protein PM082_007044 [Marasmius tenuissimus]|nr:hypothetical protein PM082_007044 [Marasmius tenuissimus]